MVLLKAKAKAKTPKRKEKGLLNGKLSLPNPSDKQKRPLDGRCVSLYQR
jgi:hypothetical protein